MAMPICFDATITIGHHHLRAAGLDPEQAAVTGVTAVRRAIERMDGANWIDVMASDYPPATPGWVIVYPRGSSIPPDTPEWRERRSEVEDMAKAALIAAASPL